MTPRPYHRPYPAQQPRQKNGRRIWRALIIIGIIVVLFFMVRAITADPADTTLVDGSNQPITVDEQPEDVAVNDDTDAAGDTAESTNENSNSNVNTNSTTESITIDSDACDQVYSRGATSEKQVSFTFNVGTTQEGEIDAVLSGLQAASVPADFFVRGDVAEQNPELIQKIATAGFGIYNLTYSHANLTNLMSEEIADEISQAEEALTAAIGNDGSPFLRPPYGAADDDVVTAAADEGYCVVSWSIDALDWSSEYTAADSQERVMSNISNGAIILMQAANATTAEIVPGLITALTEKGYEIVNLQTNLGL